MRKNNRSKKKGSRCVVNPPNFCFTENVFMSWLCEIGNLTIDLGYMKKERLESKQKQPKTQSVDYVKMR